MNKDLLPKIVILLVQETYNAPTSSPKRLLEKKFVNIDDNQVSSIFLKHIRVGDTVVVTDGSYMQDTDGKEVHGIDFAASQQRDACIRELLTVVEINKPFPTRLETTSVLSPINNCKIQGFDGREYYCSVVNIQRFSV